jgi:hypothetical protein
MADTARRKDRKFKDLPADSAAWLNSGKFRPNSGIDSADQEFTGELAVGLRAHSERRKSSSACWSFTGSI